MFKEHPGRPWQIAPEAMDAQQRALVEHILSGPRGRVPPNLLIWLNDIEFAKVAEKFGEYVSQLAPFAPRQKEIVILGVAAFFASDFEWHFHAPLARKHGLTDAQIDAIRAQRDPGLADPVDAASWALVTALLSGKGVSDALHAQAMQHLGHKGVQDIIGLMGLYTMIAQTIAFYRVPVPAG
jgi:4-carboxymuconolactone decarboxylase